jgi:hypothetical protein
MKIASWNESGACEQPATSNQGAVDGSREISQGCQRQSRVGWFLLASL